MLTEPEENSEACHAFHTVFNFFLIMSSSADLIELEINALFYTLQYNIQLQEGLEERSMELHSDLSAGRGHGADNLECHHAGHTDIISGSGPFGMSL